jgi:hypothetical protein
VTPRKKGRRRERFGIEGGTRGWRRRGRIKQDGEHKDLHGGGEVVDEGSEVGGGCELRSELVRVGHLNPHK